VTMATRPVRVLSFDLDDTIWHCAPVLSRAARKQHEYLREHFPEMIAHVPHEKAFSEYFSAAREEVGREQRGFDLTLTRKRAIERIARTAGVDPKLVVESAYQAFITERCRVADHIFEGVVARLKELRDAGFTLVSLTNGNCDLSHTPELHELFEHQLTAEGVGAAKPDPEPFYKVIELTKVDHPSEICHIGDSIYSDIGGARSVGMRTIWVNRSGAEAAEHGADLVVRCVADLPTTVEELMKALGCSNAASTNADAAKDNDALPAEIA